MQESTVRSPTLCSNTMMRPNRVQRTTRQSETESYQPPPFGAAGLAPGAAEAAAGGLAAELAPSPSGFFSGQPARAKSVRPRSRQAASVFMALQHRTLGVGCTTQEARSLRWHLGP